MDKFDLIAGDGFPHRIAQSMSAKAVDQWLREHDHVQIAEYQIGVRTFELRVIPRKVYERRATA